ncbi:hypothetical protein BT93_L5858 [Corymbia citriodora subsp. variegata]|uniref:Neprosin PEP catalytic domain-containing protein n=1 Tax=Corymbia citriodora subsp. variegata TaxID=360336 RepID=A0A8T0CR69_CORYI|nr:hypothetical protein BT93_L5858 [Corymbia citriodora subsp. variegata]
MKLLPLMFVFFGVSLCEVGNISEDDDIELERQVKMMNRPPVKTFVTEVGDTIDCIDIDKQPSLQHPLLKNHKVQKEPTLHLTGFGGNFSHTKSIQFGYKESCPVGTVPIPRITKKDLIRARALPRMPSSTAAGQDALQSNQHVLSLSLSLWVVSLTEDMTENTKYGVYGRLSTYNITVAHDQFSSHNLWIETGPKDHISMIAAGWMVSPQLYGDSLSRFFIYWTGNGYRDGCYNLLCPGFVLVDKELPFTEPLPVSTYGGDQYEVLIQIEQVYHSKFLQFVKNLSTNFPSDQDHKTGNWWLILFDDQTKIGYWPKELFLYLRDGSRHVAWGGVGLADSNGFCPPMGSGHKPDGNFKHATFIRRLQWIDAKGVPLLPSDKVSKWVDKTLVYDLQYHSKLWRRTFGHWIAYGGPGGYCRL